MRRSFAPSRKAGGFKPPAAARPAAARPVKPAIAAAVAADSSAVLRNSTTKRPLGVGGSGVTSSGPKRFKFKPPSRGPLAAVPKGGSRVNAPKIGTGGVKKSKVGGGESAAAVPSLETYWSVVWCKRSNKKHKTWEDDAVLVVKGRSATLKDLEGKTISVGSQLKRADLETLKEGESLSFGGKEIEISHEISNVDYSTGKCFLGTCSSAPAAAAQLAIPIVQSSFKAPGGGGGGGRAGGKQLAKPVQRRSKPLHNPLSYGAVVLPKPPAGRSKIVDP
eukprot:gene22683-14644_t